MQYVSTEYKESMKRSRRNKSFMRLSMGLVNQEAQQSAEIQNDGFAPFSNLKAPIDGDTVAKYYATYEQNWNSLDGSVYFLPRDSANLYNQAAVTSALIEERPAICINFNTDDPVSLKGITLKFGKSWPLEFTIETDNKTVDFENNSQNFQTEEPFDDITYLKIIAKTMSRGNTRLRIEEITCGIGLEFDDKKIIKANLRGRISPRAES